jgi:hypothetical protein
MLVIPDVRTTIPRRGLVGWWDVSLARCHTTGSTITNLAGSTNLTAFGTPSYSVGKPNGRRSVLFDTTARYYQVTTSLTALQPTTALSMSFWLKPTSYNASYNGVAGMSLSGQARGYMFDTNSVGNMTFQVGNGTWGQATVARGAVSTWTHYVGTWDGTTVRIYKNGVVSETTASKTSITYTGTALTIGRYYNLATNTQLGYFSDITIYNRALSADEITHIYNITKQQFA